MTESSCNSNLAAEAPVILALDTSSRRTSLAVMRAGEIELSWAEELDEKRSERLWVEIESRLASAGLTVADIDLFAVCVGPGGFTGLRVGIAAAGGFAWALGKPAIGITALEAAAFEASPASAICAMVNAYKGEVYSQLFSCDRECAPRPLSEPSVLTLDKVFELVDQIEPLVFAGDAAVEYRESIIERAGDRFAGEAAAGQIVKGWWISVPARPLACAVARLAMLKAKRGEADTAKELRACYVRPAEAEVKLALGLLGSKIKRSLEGK